MTAVDAGPGPERDEALLARWGEAVREATGTPAAATDPGVRAYGAELLRRWSEEPRAYHTVAHLSAVLEHVDTLAAHAAEPALVRLAAWFHDAVYRPDRSENEERSARLAERALAELGLDPSAIDEVVRLVRLTADHAVRDGDRNGAVLCDADLAVLAGTPARYRAYAEAVRAEYHFVPDPAFRTGRAEVLRRLLALPRLYGTPHGARHWEAAARRNLTAELAELAAPPARRA
ncbi:HD domain-containing protein [Streptomyces sp. LE64]|uniref:HD domain-containing protein n=1 Tax=Streptomyces sp. LE64 TaxID=3448653 RepID=UPI004041356D